MSEFRGADGGPDPDAIRLLPLPNLAFQTLLALAGGPNHGYAIAKEVEISTSGRTRPGTGSLYLSLAKMRGQGLIEVSDAPDGPGDGRRKVYRMTGLGRRVATAESRRLLELVTRARRRNLVGPADWVDLVGAESGSS